MSCVQPLCRASAWGWQVPWEAAFKSTPGVSAWLWVGVWGFFSPCELASRRLVAGSEQSLKLSGEKKKPTN